ncbi:UNVERIFIED_CONTAM: hypothetical protein FKN15_039621 [Acipenser sinensis]
MVKSDVEKQLPKGKLQQRLQEQFQRAMGRKKGVEKKKGKKSAEDDEKLLTCIQFHPSGQVIMTAWIDQSISLFQKAIMNLVHFNPTTEILAVASNAADESVRLCCRKRAAARQYSLVSQGSDTERWERGVRAFLLSEWLRGGSWGDCWPYKITFCCSLRSALLREKERRADALVQIQDTAGEENPKRHKRKTTGLAGETVGRPYQYLFLAV